MRCATTALEFNNELIHRLNHNANRYVGICTCEGTTFPMNEYFSVDEIYEIIGRVLDGIPEDEGCDVND